MNRHEQMERRSPQLEKPREEKPHQKLISQGLTNWEKPKWHNRPHEQLVGDIRRAVAEARADYEKGGGKFDPVVWIGERLTQQTLIDMGDNSPLLTASLAWDAITLSHIKNPDYRDIVESILKSQSTNRKSNTVTLEPEAVKLIDAMTEAIGVPRTRGEKQIDLLKNITPAHTVDRLRRDAGREFTFDNLSENDKHVIVDGMLFARGADGVFRYDGGIPPKKLRENSAYDMYHQPSIAGTEQMRRILTAMYPPSPDDSKYVRLPNGDFIDREFRNDNHPSSVKVVFVAGIRFLRGADGVFRACDDPVVRRSEEEIDYDIQHQPPILGTEKLEEALQVLAHHRIPIAHKVRRFIEEPWSHRRASHADKKAGSKRTKNNR